MKGELLDLEGRKAELLATCQRAPSSPMPRLHPNLAEIYRQKVARLQEELNREDLRAEAGQALRSLISEVRLMPENGGLEIELAGDLAGILTLASGNKQPVTAGRDGLQVTLVAGTRNQRYLQPFWSKIPLVARPSPRA
jgi:site-specific DNA recombinase